MGRHRIHILDSAVGVKEDFEKLFTEFSKERSLRYSVFAKTWRDMKFSDIFSLRQTDHECREVCAILFK